MNTNKVTVEVPTEFPFVVTKGNTTVKIYRVEGKKNANGYYYQVADYTNGPKRKLISFAAFPAAKAEAERIAKCLSVGDVHALEMRGSDRAAFGRAVSLLEPSGTSLELAAAQYAEAVKILGSGNKLIEAAKFFMLRHPSSMPVKTVPELITEMLSVQTARGKSDRYMQDLAGRLGRFSETFQGKVGDVDTRRVQKWLDGLGLSPQSYKNYRTVIGSLFSFAETRGYIARGTNPVHGTDRPKVGDRSVSVFTPAEFSAMLHASSPNFLPALAIGGLAGLRSAEIQRLEWADIDLPRRVITVSAEKAKTASRRTVPICDALAAWLSPFSGSTGLIWTGNGNGFVNTQRTTAKVVGIKWKGNALRHSYASFRLAELCDPAKTAMELGNSPAIVHRHYKELVRPEDAKAWFSIFPDSQSKS